MVWFMIVEPRAGGRAVVTGDRAGWSRARGAVIMVRRVITDDRAGVGLADDQHAVLILVAGRPDNSSSRIDVDVRHQFPD
jgi:hypothetical protein